MDKRIIVFIFSFSLVFMGMMLLKKDDKPNIPAADQAEQIAADADEGAADADEESAESEETQDEGSGEGSGEDEGEGDAANDPQSEQDGEEVKAATPEQFPMLGSLDPADNTRFLVTFTTRGGAIKLIESNMRKKRKDRLAYRDLEYKGGYLGDLQLEGDVVGETETDLGKTALKVRAVGKGTPADVAGVKIDDQIVAVQGPDDELALPVYTTTEFERQLAEKYKKDETIRLTVWREGVEQEIEVTLGQKPISIVRPEPDTFESGLHSPESFLLSLRKPSEQQFWPELDSEMTSAQWDFAETEVDGQPAIEFSYTITAAKLKLNRVDGPIKITRTYWLPAIPDEDRYNVNARDSHIKNADKHRESLRN